MRIGYMSVMNPGLEQIYRELENDFSWLVHKWHEFNELYARGQERIDLLNSVASNFFYFLNKSHAVIYGVPNIVDTA